MDQSIDSAEEPAPPLTQVLIALLLRAPGYTTGFDVLVEAVLDVCEVPDSSSPELTLTAWREKR